MSGIVLRTTNTTTWDEQGCNPTLSDPGSVLHARQRGPAGTAGDPATDGRVLRFRWTRR